MNASKDNLIRRYLLLINIGSFLLMGFDKMFAKLESDRIPEMFFFLLSLAAGVIGVVLGMLVFHHKTRKTSFQVKIAMATVILASILVFWLLG